VFYDSTMAAESFPSPLLHVRIGEHEATFLVDSGAKPMYWLSRWAGAGLVMLVWCRRSPHTAPEARAICISFD